MASWVDRQLSNHNVQLAAAALLSGAAVAATIYGTQAIRRKERVDELKASIPELNESHHAQMVFLSIKNTVDGNDHAEQPSEAHRVWRRLSDTCC